MANSNTPNVGYDLVLADLRAKRDEIDMAIKVVERQYPSTHNIPAPIVVPVNAVPKPFVASRKFAQMGVYEAACAVLESAGKPLTTPDLIQAISDGGKDIDMRSATTLYRSVKEKGEDCKFKRIGHGKEGTWAMKSWG